MDLPVYLGKGWTIIMTGQIISFIIGAVIVYFTFRIFIKTFRNVKEGKCAGCSRDCNLCDGPETSIH